LDKQIVYLEKNAHGSYNIKTVNLDSGELGNVLHLPLLKNVSMGGIIEIGWNGTFKNMRGLLVCPVNYDDSKKYRLIVDIHGGGFGSVIGLHGAIFRECTVLEWHLWTSLFNCVVFIPEFRSSMIYGDFAFVNGKPNHNIIDDDIKDIESGVDYLISKNIVSEDNMIIIGASAGAQRVNWLPVVSHRYKAIISIDGRNQDKMVFDKIVDKKELDYINKYYGNEKTYTINSPVANIDKIKTPILFIMGNPKFGGIDTHGTIENYHNELKKRNVDTEYMFIEDEGHNFTKPKNMKRILKKVISWIKKYFEL
jgi:dipeptidyl aminopeptidase/acylaminoacyl peptidase